MNNVIEELMSTCNYIAEDETFHYAKNYKEVLVLLNSDDLDMKLKEEILVELYRFAYYSRARKEVNSSVDIDRKENIISELLIALNNKEINSSKVYEFKRFNDSLRHAIDNPLEYIEAKYSGKIN